MNFFLLYVSLPARLYGIMSRTPFAETPFAELNNSAVTDRKAGVPLNGLIAVWAAMTAQVPHAWQCGEADRSNPEDEGQLHAATAWAGNH